MERPSWPYCEAYPRLIGTDVLRANRDDEPTVLCRFTTDKGHERGWLEVRTEAEVDGGFMARWRFTGPGLDPQQGQGRILFSAESQGRFRPSPFTCDKCKRRVRNLVFNDYWGCTSCHGLRNRSNYLDAAVREDERRALRYAELRQRVGSGRPPRMRHATYRALRTEFGRLRRTMQRLRTASANRDRDTVICGTWMTLETAQRIHDYRPHIIFDDRDD